MKKYLLLLLFFAFKLGVAQSIGLGINDTINATDNNGLKQGKWLITNKTHKLTNCGETAKVEEGEFKDGKKVGTWKSYYCNGNVKNELIFINGRPSGYAKFYFENGTISEEGMWENNRWVGQYKRYHENGQLSQEFKYNAAGTREGPQRYFYENGKVMIEGEFKDGKEAGLLKEYYEDGSLRAEKNFAGGVLDASTSKNYDAPKGGTTAPAPIKTEKAVEKKESPKVVEQPKAAENKNESLGIISDGFHKTYNKTKQVEKEGEFKNGILWEGKIYSYEGTKLVKTLIIKGGKTESVQMEK